MIKMPTAQSTTTTTTTTHKTKEKNVDDKIAKAAAKVESSQQQQKTASSSGRDTPSSNQQEPPQQQQQPQQQSGGNKTPLEQPEFIKQSLIVIEKKVRNLDKRRIKLEEYREFQRKGTVLNEDQLQAVSRYDEVLRTLELAKELEKQFIGLANDALKQQKKQLKKEQLEREEAVKEKLKESQKILSILNSFGDENIRNEFLHETNGATKLTEQELSFLDEFNKLVQPTECSTKLDAVAGESAEHLFNIIEGKNKQIAGLNIQEATISYSDLKKIFDRILNSGYWNRHEQQLNNEKQQQQQQHEEREEERQTLNDRAAAGAAESNDTNENILVEQISNLNINTNNNEQKQVNEQNENLTHDQGVYHQLNTSGEFVIVTAPSDYPENTQKLASNQQDQQANSKTFFSTLNQQDRNINEFLNRCENNDDGINFLQDSEIQHQTDQQQGQHGLHGQHRHHHQENNFQSQIPQNQDGSYYQEGKEINKDSRGGPNRSGGGSGGGNRGDYNNSGRSYPRPRYTDDQRRSGPPGGGSGPRGNNGMPPQRNGGGGGDRNDRNAGGAFPRGGGGGGGRGGYRGGFSGPRTGGPSGNGGGNPGGAPVNAGGPGPNRYPPRTQDNRPKVAQN